MKPNDDNGKLPPAERPYRVLIISGSNRRQYNCPGVDSKSRTLMLRMAERLPQEWEIDYEDLGNVFAREHIQSCNACVSTSMAAVLTNWMKRAGPSFFATNIISTLTKNHSTTSATHMRPSFGT